MADLRGQHVNSDIFHIRQLHFALDRLLFGRLENDLHRDVGSSGLGSGIALADTGKRSMDCESR